MLRGLDEAHRTPQRLDAGRVLVPEESDFLDRSAGCADQLLSSSGTLQTNRGAVGGQRESRHQTIGAQRPAVLGEVVFGDDREPAVIDLRLEVLRGPFQRQIFTGRVRDSQRAQPSQGSATIAGIADRYIAGTLNAPCRRCRQIGGFGEAAVFPGQRILEGGFMDGVGGRISHRVHDPHRLFPARNGREHDLVGFSVHPVSIRRARGWRRRPCGNEVHETSVGYRLRGAFAGPQKTQCFGRFGVVEQFLRFEHCAHFIRRHAEFHAADVDLAERHRRSGERDRCRHRGLRRRLIRGRGCCRGHSHSVQPVYGGDQHPAFLRRGAGVQGNGGILEPGLPARQWNRIAEHAVGLLRTRLDILKAVVAVYLRRCSHVEMTAHYFVVEALPGGLLQRGKEAILRQEVRRVARICGLRRCRVGRRVGPCAAPAAEQGESRRQNAVARPPRNSHVIVPRPRYRSWLQRILVPEGFM